MDDVKAWTIYVCEEGCGYFRDQLSSGVHQIYPDSGPGRRHKLRPATVCEIAPVLEALRYIAGEDVAGWQPHLPPQEVARSLLTRLSPDGEA